MDVKDARVVVMGGSSGIGRATAALLREQGADVVVVGRSRARLDEVAAALGVGVEEVDATDRAALDGLFERLGVVDHLVVAVSGAAGAGPFASLDLEALRAAFVAKTFAQLDIVQAALPALSAAASITLITAASAQCALSGTAGLAAVNGALEAAVGPLAVELAPRRVNAVSPGVVDTPWWHGVPDEHREALFADTAASLPVGHVGCPEDLAGAVAALVSNPFVTGHVLVADGGAHLAR